MLSFSEKRPHGVRSKMATVLIRRTEAVKRAEQSVPPGDRTDEGHWFQMKGRSWGGRTERERREELFSNLVI